MAGWSMLDALTGLRYDGFAERVAVRPPIPTTGRFPFVAGAAWGTLELRTSELEIKPQFGHLLVRSVASGAFPPRQASLDGKSLATTPGETLELGQTVDLKAGSVFVVSA
jgi:hypothetical protein